MDPIVPIEAFGGLYNTGCGDFEIIPNEVAAMTFSNQMPAVNTWYDENHSVVTTVPGVYEISYHMRAKCNQECCEELQMAVTMDGDIIPGSAVTQYACHKNNFDIRHTVVAEVPKGAHLHCIVYGKKPAKLSLYDDTNLTLYVKKIADVTKTTR